MGWPSMPRWSGAPSFRKVRLSPTPVRPKWFGLLLALPLGPATSRSPLRLLRSHPEAPPGWLRKRRGTAAVGRRMARSAALGAAHRKTFHLVSLERRRAWTCWLRLANSPGCRGWRSRIANDLARDLRCDRVSVGVMRRNGSIRLRAMSHSASFKQQGRLVDAIENAMEEAIEQRSSVAYPPLPSTERAVTMAHRALAEIAG